MVMMSEGNRLNDVLHRELDRDFCRENVTFGKDKKLLVGTVVGRRLFSVPDSGTAAAGNTGLGSVDNVSIGHMALYGTYTLSCVEISADGGKFHVTTPEGVRLHDAQVGEAFVSPHINFTINDGDPDFVVGDIFTIEVSPGDGLAYQIDFSATDGRQIAYGFPIADYDATEFNVNGVVIKKDAKIDGSALIWPADATDEQKKMAMGVLASRGFINKVGL
ncbi:MULTISPECIES: head decoration protein [unclassified Maridesulfovibrio]|uniref:head decoration protein n=1 Tax=unclassified Maridesulfovibrio TaxID=2794999 RepID=UPI003B41CB8E